MHKSIATIDAPEFINLQPLDINPLMSSCEIKVLYLGENRNHSYITKEVATEMAKTLRGAPIVGYFKQDKEDFADHGNRMILDDEGIKFECLTKPYGFVAPDARVWFQTFEDTDDFGNKEVREYLMTTGYLWTGQFEECQIAVEEGRPHSMELDEETLDGHWANNPKNHMDFFIINDATFSKLCILGDDVEPCFEGSSITAPKVSSSFTKMDDEFKKTLFTMMQELQFALQGGQPMEQEIVEVVEEVVETSVVTENEDIITEPVAVEGEGEPTPAPATEEPAASVEEEIAVTAEVQEEASVETVEEDPSFAKKDEEEEEEPSDDVGKKEEDSDTQPEEEPAKEDEEPAKEEEEEEDDKKKYELLQNDYSTLQNSFEELQAKYCELEAVCAELAAFKEKVIDADKDAMIAKFSILSDEDKADVIENKSKYSLDEIEAKLSVICVRKKVSFDLDNTLKNDINTEEPDVTTFNLANTGDSAPAWISAVRNNTKNK